MAKTDPVIDGMNAFALALLDAAREARVATATGETDHLSIAERVNVFREVAKWISIKNRLPEPAEGGDLDDYRARLGKAAFAGESRADDPGDPRGQAKVLIEQGRAIAERAVTNADAGACADAFDNARAAAALVPRPPVVGTPGNFDADGRPFRGNPALRPRDPAGGGPELEAIKSRLPSAGGGDAGGVRVDRGFAYDLVTGRARGLRRRRDGAVEPDADDVS